MKQVFVNLKRFDVPKSMGGICPQEKVVQWIEWVVDECIKLGIGKLEEVSVSFMFPESLIVSAVNRLQRYPQSDVRAITVGSQGVYREDVTFGGNFGAFSTNRPASAMKSLGCSWTMIGHSEERKDKLGILSVYDPSILNSDKQRKLAKIAVDHLLNEEVKCSINRNLKVLLCIGETAEEKGEGDLDLQKPRIKEVLKEQIVNGLKGLNKSKLEGNLVIGYEPIWAIGPGKTPPESEYIAFVSHYIKEVMQKEFDFRPSVVYGGGLKEDNAGAISKIDSIDGGLVALTRFSGDIGFYPEEFKRILDKYMESLEVE